MSPARVDDPVQVHLLGVRGSTPCPGSDFTRYGGHTSCVAIGRPGQVPHLVLDLGTGVRSLGALTDSRPFDGVVLLTHLHWDHTQGLPFSSVLDHPDSRVDLFLPAQERPPVEVIERVLSPPHFPIGVDGLRGEWTVTALDPGRLVLDDATVIDSREVPHKGGVTYGYRIEVAGAVVVYIPDHGPAMVDPGPDGFGALDPGLVEWCRGADLLLHDAQHVDEEFPAAIGWGHSTIRYAVALARAATVGRLVLFHHAPGRTDDQLDEIAKVTADLAAVPTTVGAEGMVLEIPELPGT